MIYWALGGAAVGAGAFLLTLGVDVFPFFLLAALGVFIMRTPAFRGMGRSFGNPPSTNSRPTAPVSFDDVGGQRSAKQELVEALDFLSDPDRVVRMGIRPLKGILLTGPPGTGKTLLAKAAATYTHSAFVSAAGSEFIEMYAGVGAQRVRQIFSRARESARQEGKGSAIIFIDEIEVLAGKRGQAHGHVEYDQTINQLLVEMDGLKPQDPIQLLVMAATNRADLLDEAVVRPGRFDRIVKVDLPDRQARLDILKIHTRNKPLEDVDLDRVARESFGFSGAHLESLANEAAILAYRANKDKVSEEDFIEAIDKVIMGEKIERRPTDEERQRVALHESGHALMAELSRPGSVATITISPRGGALGYVRHSPEDDHFLQTRHELESHIMIALAGAVSEEICLNERSTGASGDYQQAFEAARRMVFGGMTSLGIVAPDSLPERELHRALSRLLRDIEDKVHATLLPYKGQLEQVAHILLEDERIDGTRFRSLFGVHQPESQVEPNPGA